VYPVFLHDFRKVPCTHISSSLYSRLVQKAHCIKAYTEPAAISIPSTYASNMPTVIPLYVSIFRFSREAILHICMYLVTSILSFSLYMIFLRICRFEKDVQKMNHSVRRETLEFFVLEIHLIIFRVCGIVIESFFYIFPLSQINEL